MTSTTTPKHGEKFEVSGIRYLPHESVKIYIGGSVGAACDPQSFHGGIFVGTGHTDANGKFDPKVTMPSSLNGDQLLVGIGASGKGYDFDFLTLHVAGSGSGGGSSQPPAHTGTDIALMFGAAAVLLLAGTGFILGGRRRRLGASA